MQLAIVNCTALLGTEGDETRFVNGVTIEIDGGRITRIDIAPTSRPVADEVIDARGMVVMPGLVSDHHGTHRAAAFAAARGRADDCRLEDGAADQHADLAVGADGEGRPRVRPGSKPIYRWKQMRT